MSLVFGITRIGQDKRDWVNTRSRIGIAQGRKGGGVGLNTNKLVSVAQVDWNGQTIKLKKFQNLDLRATGIGSYAVNFDELNYEIANFIVNIPSQCNWKKIPNSLRVIIDQRKAFDSVNNHNAYSIDLMLTGNRRTQ